MTNPPAGPRTAGDVAREILDRYGLNPNWGDAESLRFITEQIQQAAAQARKEGFEQAREISALVAESEIETWDRVKNFERVKQCQIIAECIRALQPPSEGER